MKQAIVSPEYLHAVKAIKQAILESRYRAAKIKNMRIFYEAWGPVLNWQLTAADFDELKKLIK